MRLQAAKAFEKYKAITQPGFAIIIIAVVIVRWCHRESRLWRSVCL